MIPITTTLPTIQQVMTTNLSKLEKKGIVMISRNRTSHNKLLFIGQDYTVLIRVKNLQGIILTTMTIGERQRLRGPRSLLKYMRSLISAKMTEMPRSKNLRKLLRLRRRY